MSATKKRCPRCKKKRRFRGHKASDRGHGPGWHRNQDGLLVCYICHPENLLAVACPYTSCGVPSGLPCVNVRDGGTLEHGHPERGVLARKDLP